MYVYVCIKIKLGTSVQPSCTDVLPKQLRKQSLKIYTWVTTVPVVPVQQLENVQKMCFSGRV